MPLCRISSSQSCEANTDTCGENALKMISVTCDSTFPVFEDSAREGERTVEPVGEKTEPFTALVGGVTVPDSLGEAALFD